MLVAFNFFNYKGDKNTKKREFYFVGEIWLYTKSTWNVMDKFIVHQNRKNASG